MLPVETKFRTWITLAPFSSFEMRVFPRPKKVGKHTTPENLNDLTIGQLIDMSSVGEGAELFTNICGIVLGMKPKEVMNARAVDVVRFVGWVTGEVGKINRLFESTSVKPTELERRAGIEKLQFGLFGMLDYYALRMGFQDHDDVLKVKWLRIYKCIDIDNQKNQYQRRLQEVMTNDYRRKSR